MDRSYSLRPMKLRSSTPQPLSLTSIDSKPCSRSFTSIKVAPASNAFSTNSFTAIAKLSTTCESIRFFVIESTTNPNNQNLLGQNRFDELFHQQSVLFPLLVLKLKSVQPFYKSIAELNFI